MKRQTVSLCMIARDEEACIGQAIKSALAVVDEIVVGDTGSSDNTRIIAEGYGARVVDVPWREDFSAARNAVLDQVNNDWVLVLDADERLQPIRPVEFQKLLAHGGVSGYRVRLHEDASSARGDAETQVRLFRNHPHVRYCYPVHESVEIALENWSASRQLKVSDSRLCIKHDGSDTSRVASRMERNRRLLRDAVAEYPYEPFFILRLAEDALELLEDEVLPLPGHVRIHEQLERAWHIVSGMSDRTARDLDYGPQLAGLLSASYLALGETQRAVDVVWNGLDLYAGDPLLLFRRAAALARHLSRSDELGLTRVSESSLRRIALDDLRACLDDPDAETRDPGRRWRWLWPFRHLGELSLQGDDPAEALVFYNQALELDSSYSHAWSGKGDCARLLGDDRQALGYYLRAVTLEERNLGAWLRGSEILEILGFVDNARSWRRRARELFPEHPAFQGDRSWLDDLISTATES